MKENNILTDSQVTLITIGTMIGIGVLSLPNDVIKIAKQDGWISVILGVVYPLYIIFLGSYISKYYPKEDILLLSKKFFGKIIGNIFNLVFIAYFIFAATQLASGTVNLINLYMVRFLNKWNILIVMYLVITYAVYHGSKTVGRLNEFLFFVTLGKYLIPLFAIKDSNILNVMPLLGSGIPNIIKGTKETIFAYLGIEIIFIIYPFLQDSKSLKKCGLKSIAFTTAVYTIFTFVNIVYLGVDASLKFQWPIVKVTESLMIPIINSFRYVFMSLWLITMFKAICNHYFVFTFGLSEIMKKIKRKNIVVMTFPIMIIISSFYGNTTTWKNLIGIISYIFLSFNIVFASLIAIFVHIKNQRVRS